MEAFPHHYRDSFAVAAVVATVIVVGSIVVAVTLRVRNAELLVSPERRFHWRLMRRRRRHTAASSQMQNRHSSISHQLLKSDGYAALYL